MRGAHILYISGSKKAGKIGEPLEAPPTQMFIKDKNGTYEGRHRFFSERGGFLIDIRNVLIRTEIPGSGLSNLKITRLES